MTKIQLEVPDNVTNGDVIQVIFPNAQVTSESDIHIYVENIDSYLPLVLFKNWWNAPFKLESEVERMGNIELVITTPEEMYNTACNYPEMVLAGYSQCIKNGRLLPKGHGDLKDANVIVNKLCTQEASEFFGSATCAEILDFINNEKTIIEADTRKSVNAESK